MATSSTVHFEDFDDETVFERLSTKAQEAQTKNFVLEFNSESAVCAFDLGEGDIETLLSERGTQHANKESLRTRWINVWMPETQQRVINHIARHYGFSPRLESSMGCGHLRPVPVGSLTTRQQHRTAREMMHGMPRKGREANPAGIASMKNDLEAQEMSPMPSSKAAAFDVNHYRIVNEVWHFASIDWGRKFTCIGFNSLYRSAENVSDDEQAGKDKPAGKRVWTWLILCDDQTIIAIHENPHPFQDEPPVDLLSIRHNLLNVFRQLSKSSVNNRTHNPIMTVNIRSGLHKHEGDEAKVSEDSGASLLFYYLFDDWYTSYALVARYHHQYGARLERVRELMFTMPNLDSANKLHHLGRQLAVLKRIYESYTMIIDRLLKGPQASFRGAPAIGDIRVLGPVADNLTSQTADPIRAAGSTYGVPVSTESAVRFERLRDRISLYALSEIQDCLAEKEALVMLTFNLVALKESSYVERLTRITILLAKLTALFLPVSLLCAYFAIPIVGYGDSYTLAQFWTSFAVIFAISVAALVIFGQLSGTQEGAPIYRSLTSAAYDISRHFFSRKQSEKREKAIK